MKIIYATSITYPSRLANRIQTMTMASEFSKELREDFFIGGQNINAEGLGIKNVINFGNNLKSLSLSIKHLLYIKEQKISHVFCREENLLFFIILLNKIYFRLNLIFVFESHGVPKKLYPFYVPVIRWSNKVVVISTGIKNRLIKSKFRKDKILIAHDGVDLNLFDISLSKNECRKKLNLRQNQKIVIYTGHLYSWKGAQTLADASLYLDPDFLVFFIGGKDSEVSKFRKKNIDKKNILITGYKPHKDIPIYLKAADVLIVPNTGKDKVSKYYTSPMKLFEYMASGVPMVVSDLPSIRDILSNKNAILVCPDNPVALADGIKNVFTNHEFALKIAKQAYIDVKEYTWIKRTNRIVEFIKN